MNRCFSKFLLIILLGFNFIALNVEAQSGAMKGLVKDDRTKSPIEFATITLYSTQDSSLITGSISDTIGYFEINKLPNNNYYAKIGFIGFETKVISNIIIDAANPVYDFGTISLTSFSENMDEFEVVEEKDLIETQIDKRVYNVSKDISAQGKTGLEVLKNMPTIDVDEQDNISLRGDQSVKILIDGRPSSMNPAQLLNQIPSSSIEKIEIITNPSAKYNPEGMSGIINVILKKEKASGFNGNYYVNYSYNDYNNGSNGLSLSFKKNKVAITARIGYFKRTWRNYGVDNRTYLTNDSLHYQQLIDTTVTKFGNPWYFVGMDYSINKKNLLYFESSGWTGTDYRYNYNHYDFSDNNNVIQNYSNRNSVNSEPYYEYYLNAGWQSQFKKEDHTLDFDIKYAPSHITNKFEINQQFFDTLNNEISTPDYQNTENKKISYDLNIKLDYVLPITDSLILESGIAATIADLDDAFFSESNDSLNVFYPDTNLNNHLLYNETVTAFYVTLGKQFKKLGVKTGVRIENTLLQMELEETKQDFSQNYFSFFPSVHFSYKFKEGNEFQLSYSKRLNRPDTWELNPFSKYTNPYSLWMGNPNLKPEYIDVYELSYLRIWKKFNINPSIYYRQVNDKKSNLTSLNPKNITISTPENISTAQIHGAELIMSYKPFKWWRINSSFNYWAVNAKDNNLDQVINNSSGWMLQITSTKTIKKKWTLQLRGRYNGKSERLQGYTYPRYSANVSLGRKILKNKGRINVSYNDIFNTQGWHFVSSDLGNNYSYEKDRKWSSRSVRLSFSYYFGKMKYGSQKRHTKDHSSGDNIDTGGSGENKGK